MTLKELHLLSVYRIEGHIFGENIQLVNTKNWWTKLQAGGVERGRKDDFLGLKLFSR